MAISNIELRKIIAHVQTVRMKLLLQQPFYGSLLMHVPLSLDEHAETAYTDGDRIYLGTKFIQNLTDEELSFVLLHELLHIVFKHCKERGHEEFEQELYNIACDIVINSNILYSFHGDLKSITIREYGPLMHQTPTKEEGYLYTSEEVYRMLLRKVQKHNRDAGNQLCKRFGHRLDDHSRWKSRDHLSSDEMEQHVIESTILAKQKEEASKSGSKKMGNIPLFAQRMLDELRNPQLDWRTLLQNFVQEEVNDYGWNPPDVRFQDSPFFLPSFQEKDERVKDVLFMIDTSGSMDRKMITNAFSEIKGAIEQFNGRLQGKLGFFDVHIKEIYPFEDVDSLLSIIPVGGGGTSFCNLLDEIRHYEEDHEIACVVILTDGYAKFPSKNETNLPVLWILNSSVVPPWGKVARIHEEKENEKQMKK